MFSFQKNSLAGTGWVILLISMVVKWAGLDIDDGQITELAIAFITIFGFVAALVGQVMREDLVYGFWRK